MKSSSKVSNRFLTFEFITLSSRFIVLCFVSHNVLQLGEVADLEALAFNLAPKFI
jgi:hypothetical protein